MIKKRQVLSMVSIAVISFLIGTTFNIMSFAEDGNPFDEIWEAIHDLEEYVYGNVETLPIETIQGRPNFSIGYEVGIYIWTEDDTWHIRWTGDYFVSNDTYVIEFKITTNGNFTNVKTIDFEFEDSLVVSTNTELSGRCGFNWRYDGLDFNVFQATEVIFDLRISGDIPTALWNDMTIAERKEATFQIGVHYDPYLIFLGKNKQNPNKPIVKVLL